MAVSTFEGLPTGSVTAAAAGFDFISAPSGGGAQVISTNPYRGTRCLQLTTGSSGAICYAERAASLGSSSTGSLYGRCRFRVPVLPGDTTGMRIMVVTDSPGAFLGDVRIINSGKLQLRSGAGTVLATSTLTLSADTWVDVGIAVLVFSSTVGQLQLRIWNSDGSVAETLTSSANLNTLGSGGSNKAQVGAVRSGVNLFTVVVDDVDWSTSGYPTISTTHDAAVDLAAASTLTAAGGATAVAAVALSAATELSAAAVVDRPAGVALSAASAMTATATHAAAAGAALSAASGLTTAGTGVVSAAAPLAAASTFTAAGQVTAPAAAALSASASLTAAAVAGAAATVALSAASGLTAETTGQSTAAANLSGTSALTAAADRTATTSVTLGAASALTAGATRLTSGSAQMSAATDLAATATHNTSASATMTAVSDLTADAAAGLSAHVALGASSSLTATATIGEAGGPPGRGTVTTPPTRVRIRRPGSQVQQPSRRVVIR